MYIFPCKRIRYIKPIAINTHIDCLNNSKCSVRYIFKATKQGALKVTLDYFLLDPGEHVLKKFTTEVGEQDFPVKWFNFIYPMSKPTTSETSILTPVHVAYSPITFVNHHNQWIINLHSPPSLPTLYNLKSTMFHFGYHLLHSTTEPQHDLPSLASSKGEMASSFSWTSLFKSPTSSLQSLIKSSCYMKLTFVSPSRFLFVTLSFILELHFCPHPRLDRTSQRGIFKTNILHLQVKYNQERLMKPHLSILSGSTSHYPMERRILLFLTKPCPLTSR